jgi:subtilisin family serine protease
MALKFLDANGSGTLAGAIAVIDYAVGQRAAGVNLRVLSNSWGGGGFNQALFDAISAANAAGILFVAAAGGSGSNNDLTPAFPASYDVPNVVAVAATDRQDRLAGFSNWGPTSVDIAAPGVDILSTVRGGYQVYSGTSMSTPIVAGVAALVLAVDGSLDTAEVKDVVLATGDPLPSLAGLIATGRRVNAASALAAVAPPPDGPLELSIESVSRVRDSFEFRVGLVWRGASGRLVELYRNRELVDIPDNDGEHLDRFRRYQTAYVWKVCERPIEPDAECSNDVTINFGPSGTEATIVTPTGTRRVPVRVVD